MSQKHFIIVGAQRSGTTYLYKLLEEHPNICMAKPLKPEPKYFIKDQNLSYDNYFDNFFTQNSKYEIYGEKSTSYYEKEKALINISKLIPEAKIIFILRNPVERAISNYFFTLNNKIESRSLLDVFINDVKSPKLEINKISVNPFNYLERGLYYKYIDIFKQYFKTENIKVLIFEEIVNNLDEIQKLYKYLNIDDSYVPKGLGEKVNSSLRDGIISNEIIEKLNNYYHQPKKKLEHFLSRKISVWKS